MTVPTVITIADLERVADEYSWTRVRAKGRIGWFRDDGYVAVVLDDAGQPADATSDFLPLVGVVEHAVFDRLATPQVTR